MKKKLAVMLLGAGILVAFKTVKDVLTDVGTTISEVEKFTLEQIAKKNFNLPH